MDTVTAPGTGAGGLATTGVRWALIFALAMSALKTVIDGRIAPSPVTVALAYLLALVAMILLTHPENRPLHGWYAALVPVCALSATALELLAQPDQAPVWLLHFASYPIALLFVRGNLILGGASALAQLGIVTGWAAWHQAGWATPLEILIAPLVAYPVGVIWQLTLRIIVAQEQAHRAAAAEHTRQVRRQQAASAYIRRELDLVRARTENTLTRLRDGTPLADEFRREIAVIEGELRDRLRSPQLQHPALNQAIAVARARGISVTVLADPLPEALPLTDRAATELATLVGAAGTAERLVISWTEPARMTLVTQQAERSERQVVALDAG